MIVLMTNMGYYELLYSDAIYAYIYPLYHIGNGYIRVLSKEKIMKTSVLRSFNANEPIVSVTSTDDINEDMLSFVSNRTKVEHWRHTNGIHELTIKTNSRDRAKAFFKHALKLELSQYRGQVNWRILYKEKWWDRYHTYKEGIYAK